MADQDINRALTVCFAFLIFGNVLDNLFGNQKKMNIVLESIFAFSLIS